MYIRAILLTACGAEQEMVIHEFFPEIRLPLRPMTRVWLGDEEGRHGVLPSVSPAPLRTRVFTRDARHDWPEINGHYGRARYYETKDE